MRRLGEELGFSCPLTPITSIGYTLKLEKNLWELEYTHIFKGILSEEKVHPNPEEVCEIKWLSPDFLREDIFSCPQIYTRWFRLYMLKHFEVLFEKPQKVLSA